MRLVVSSYHLNKEQPFDRANIGVVSHLNRNGTCRGVQEECIMWLAHKQPHEEGRNSGLGSCRRTATQRRRVHLQGPLEVIWDDLESVPSSDLAD